MNNAQLTSINTLSRKAGILAHPTSFPGPYGIGDLGKGAYKFVDFLIKSGQKLWQTLPIGPTGFGDSPYQPFSSFAGQPLIISIDYLLELCLINSSDLIDMPENDPHSVNYGNIYLFKTALLKLAFDNFTNPSYKDKLSNDKALLKEFSDFKESNAYWLDDYSLFMAGKDYHNGLPWYEWEDSLKAPTSRQKNSWIKKLENYISYYKFIQFIFYKEWNALKKYCNSNEIEIIGDIPMFVAFDSADVWANKDLFQLDSNGYPTVVAGVPPDYFSSTGQLWGNPLYKWSKHKVTNYSWWINRIKYQLTLNDYIRIDHFRAFDTYWAVPYEDKTAENGSWEKGPSNDFFTCLFKELNLTEDCTSIPIIAEDLGNINDNVLALRDAFSLPGMKVLQFAFEDPKDNLFMPHNHTQNSVCYTGTHDNNTTLGWYNNTSEEAKDKLRRYYSTDGSDVSWVLIRSCLGSVAKFAIIPIQDVFSLDSWARFNTPGETFGNWSFRFTENEINDQLAFRLKEYTTLFGR